VGELIYTLCGLTSVTCAILLTRANRGNPAPLLAWSSGCFWLLAVNNALLFVDLILVPRVDLSILPHSAAFAALCALLVGFIWDTR
jgi:uncharacterized protein DUF5985